MENLEVGDKVKTNGKYSVNEKEKGKVWVVKSNPWDFCGKAVISLKGYPSSYPIDGLDLVEKNSIGQISLFDE